MADYGHTDVSGWGTAYTECEARYKLTLVTPGETAEIQSLSAYLYESVAAGNHSVLALVYDSSGNLVDQSDCRQDVSLTPAWITFTGFTASLTSGQNYYVGVHGANASGDLRLRTRAGSGYRVNTPSSILANPCVAYTPDDPITPEAFAIDCGIYITLGEASVVAVAAVVADSESTPYNAIILVEAVEPNFFLQDRLMRDFVL